MRNNYKKTSNKGIVSIFLASTFFLFTSSFGYYYYSSNHDYYTNKLESVNKATLYLEKVDNSLNKIYKNDENDFQNLNLNYLLVDVSLKKYPLPPLFTKQWDGNKKIINDIIMETNNLVDLKNNIIKVNSNYQTLLDNSFNLQRNLALYNNQSYNKIGQEIVMIASSLSNIENTLYGNDVKSIEKEYLLLKNLKSMNYYLNSLINGSSVLNISPITNSQTLELIKTAQLSFYSYSTLIPKISDNLSALNKVKSYSKLVIGNLDSLELNLDNYVKEIKVDIERLDYFFYASLASILGLMICLILLGKRFYTDKNLGSNFYEINNKYQNNKTSVKNLIYSLDPLKAGDLTREIKNSDKLLENIAKIFDSTRRTILDIVKGLLHESGKIINTSKEINTFSKSMLNDFDNQKKVIGQSLEKFTEITSSLEDISQNTYFTAEDAKQSEILSNNGLSTVHESITKMNDIRNNLQESSKKIKKLGESAQGVVEVTSVIRGITKEINILAFNAAIEASTANSKGNSFSVMANEVQRLALLSSTASKDIDNKIKEILEDAGQAVISMEETTQQIVDGTVLNENAVKILDNLADFSERISQNVSAIAEKIDLKSDEMVDLSVVFRDIQKMNSENAGKINQTREKVNNIQQYSENLNELVSRYKINN